MMRRALLFLFLLSAVPLAAAQDAPLDSLPANAYRIYTATGQLADLADIGAAMDESEVIFIGEQHNDPVAHALQLALLQRAYHNVKAASDSSKRSIALSLEMFERDVQPILDEYLDGLITERYFLRSSRPWDNYASDYKPMVEFARAHDLPVIAANAPRRYVNRVTRLGPASLADLPAYTRPLLPPLPYPEPLSAYAAKWQEAMHHMMAEAEGKAEHPVEDDSTAVADTSAAQEHEHAEDEDAASPHGMGGHLLDAQALWDAAMAHSIADHLLRAPNTLLLHVAGSFHVEEGLGTPAQLKHYRPGTRTLVVVVQPADDVTSFDAEDHARLGDFIILTNDSLPRSYDASF